MYYRVYFCAALDEHDKDFFASFLADLYDTSKENEADNLIFSKYTNGKLDVFLFELPVSEEQWGRLNRMLLEQSWDTRALMAVEITSKKMVSAYNINDCIPGAVYTWGQFVDFVTSRLGVQEK